LGGGVFLQNVLPLGERGLIDSAGTMPLIYVAVGLEVAAGFALMLFEFVHQLAVEPGGGGGG
ncbi:MAG: sodium:proton antiporter, partial [Candidatus Dormibacteraceae bacterium]